MRFRKLSPAPDVLIQTVVGEAVLLDLRSQKYFGLNEVGTRAWQLLAETGDAGAVRSQLARSIASTRRSSSATSTSCSSGCSRPAWSRSAPVRKLRAFLALPGAERCAFLEAWAWTWASVLALRALGLSRSLGLWPPPSHAGVGGGFPRAAKWIRVAARNTPGADTCLVWSLALLGVLRRGGVPAELRIGVGATRPGLDAHAWVEVRGVPVDDAGDVATRYAAFSPLRARPLP